MTSYSSAIQKRISRNLLQWFDRHQREMPWRNSKDPYWVWVSEIMLQQTQVATVIPYFKRFIERFPDVRQLAKAQEQTVLKYWEGLGYYRRARSLHQAAQVVVRDFGGEFPSELQHVLSLPGIGRYTAGAVLSIAKGQPLPVLEGNTIRVHARLAGIDDDVQKSTTQKQLWSLAESVVDAERPGDLNQALMELGSEICTPRSPNCERCPVQTICHAYRTKRQLELPFSSKKNALTELHEVVVLLLRRGKLLLRQCQPGERWAGLWDFPRFQIEPRHIDKELPKKVEGATGLSIQVRDTGWSMQHGVTRFKIQLSCWVADEIKGRLRSEGQILKWYSPSELEDLPLSVTGRKVARDLPSLLVSRSLFP
jgi:A/G-specific adenine glycosylase